MNEGGRDFCLPTKFSMGNLILTTSELDPGEERSTQNLRNVGKSLPKPLGLISKPLLSTHPVPDEPLWRRLGSNLRDAFFARKLPPLELASRPIAVADPLAVRRNPVSSAISFVLHAGIFAFILWFGFQARKEVVSPKPVVVAIPVFVKPYIPVTAPAPTTMGGGGGGGAHQVIAANKGHLPPSGADAEDRSSQAGGGTLRGDAAAGETSHEQ